MFASVSGLVTKNIEQRCEGRNSSSHSCHFSKIKNRKLQFIQMTFKLSFYYGGILGFLLFLVFLFHGFQSPPGMVIKSLNSYGFIEWAFEQVRSTIYWLTSDVLFIVSRTLYRWMAIKSPTVALGILCVAIITASLFSSLMRMRIQKNRIASFAIDCPVCGSNAPPVPGTENRYRCYNGHLFSSAYHGW